MHSSSKERVITRNRSENHKLNHVVTNPDLILVDMINVSSQLQEQIDNFSMLNLSERVEINQYDFINPLKNICLEKFKTIDPNVKEQQLLRVLLTKSPNGVRKEDGVHRDSDDYTHWSFLVHLKGNSGDTLFYESMINPFVCKSVSFKPGKIMIFPSIYPHEGCSSTTIDRYTINFIVELDTELNKKVLEKSSPSILKSLQ